jgi:hypothetical protein
VHRAHESRQEVTNETWNKGLIVHDRGGTLA